MNEKMILVEQMQMLVDLYAVQTNEKQKDLAVLIIAQVLAHHQQDGLEG
ncbi:MULTISPECIES: hypothetical protein [Shewanella]|nr:MULTISPECIES: hypothetical protein [Shewanella]MCS6158417.1 hypothetical protein [Shewanella baltica]MCS6178941.1 hypothetical protein [Shewanella baltica]MCS6255105.1 hypothetical protein [Shewanella baltica]MCU8012517.1 hypothetical protein [Shewanella sp. SM74]